MNKKLITKKRAFTLMEILVAASIFAGIMIIATGVLAQSSSFRGKIRATREVSGDSRRLADMITRDVRNANGEVQYTVGSPGVTYKFKNGLAFLKYNASSSSLSPQFEATPLGNFDTILYTANVLIIATKDNFIIYGSNTVEGRVCRGTLPVSSIIGLNTFIVNVGTCGSINNKWYDDNKAEIVIVGNADATTAKPEMVLKFGGYLPEDLAIIKQQPYVLFDIVSETKDYDSLQPNSRARMEIRSSVTARSFAN